MTALLNEIKKRLGLPCSSSSPAASEFVDAAPFVSPFARGERVFRIADWTGQGKTTANAATTGSNPSPSLSVAGIEEDWTLSLADDASSPLPAARKGVRSVVPPKGLASISSNSLNKPRTQKVKTSCSFGEFTFLTVW